MEEKVYSRYQTAQDGQVFARYTAIDPADQAVLCTCGKPGCPRGRLRPFRKHISELYRVLSNIFEEEIAVSGNFHLGGTLYGLRMAASIEDVVADTSFVEDPMVHALCEPSIDYDNAESEVASKYVAGATIFNFLWQAYEATVAGTAQSELTKLLKEARLGERGRRLFEARLDMSVFFPGLSEIVGVAFFQCQHGDLFGSRLTRIKERFTGRDLVAAAELCREFRNFLVHGEDHSPSHEDWDSRAVSRCRLYRFYSVSRLLLYLIQALAWIGLADGAMFTGEDDTVFPCRNLLETLQFDE